MKGPLMSTHSACENMMIEYSFQDINFCALTILVTQRKEVLVFITRTTCLLQREMICVSSMNVWSLSRELEKINFSLHPYIDPLAKHLVNLRISVETLNYSCQILVTLTEHVLL